jgi:AraC-like DNA-binding protein
MKARLPHRRIHFGADRVPYFRELPRHQHLSAYATLVLDGRFAQLSYAGRLLLQSGDVLINPTLDSHANQMISRGITLVRLPWRQEASVGGVYRNLAIDLIRRVAVKDPIQASGLLAEQVVCKPYAPIATRDWPDKLVMDLHDNPKMQISQWAKSLGLTREYAWRCFRRTFGIGPAQFRSELTARAALLKIIHSTEPLAKAAADFGFSDQSHMTRAIKALTGVSPGRWRGSHLFKTDLTGVADSSDGDQCG